jgi:hypothetical protein
MIKVMVNKEYAALILEQGILELLTTPATSFTPAQRRMLRPLPLEL